MAARKTEEQKAADLKAKEEAKAKREQEKKDKAAAKAAKPAKPAAVKQNGVTRPARGATMQVWDIADKISAANKAPATRAEVKEAASKLAEPLNEGTVNTQYGRWRTFHGLSSLRTESNKEKAAQKEAEKAAEKTNAGGAEGGAGKGGEQPA